MRLRLTGTTPSGHAVTLMPGRMYFIDDSQAPLAMAADEKRSGPGVAG